MPARAVMIMAEAAMAIKRGRGPWLQVCSNTPNGKKTDPSSRVQAKSNFGF